MPEPNFPPHVPDQSTVDHLSVAKLTAFWNEWTANGNSLAIEFLTKIYSLIPKPRDLVKNAVRAIDHGAKSIIQHIQDGPRNPTSWGSYVLTADAASRSKSPDENSNAGKYSHWYISPERLDEIGQVQHGLSAGFVKAMRRISGTYKTWLYHRVVSEADVSDWLQGNVLEICLIAINSMLENQWVDDGRQGKQQFVNLRAQHYRFKEAADEEYPEGEKEIIREEVIRGRDAIGPHGIPPRPAPSDGPKIATYIDHSFVLEDPRDPAEGRDEEVVAFVEVKKPGRVDFKSLGEGLMIDEQTGKPIIQLTNLPRKESQRHLAQVLLYRAQYDCNFALLSDGKTNIPLVFKQLGDHEKYGSHHVGFLYWLTGEMMMNVTESLLFLMYWHLVLKGLLDAEDDPMDG